MSQNIITITGSSCAGKSTLEVELTESNDMYKIVSTTTRPQRKGELHGVDYYFTDEETFNEMVFAERVSYNGYSYGIEINELRRAWDNGTTPVVVVEPHGLSQIIDMVDKLDDVNLVSVFMGIDKEIQFNRFLTRFSLDILDGYASTIESITKTYSNRLTSMVETESSWVDHDNEYGVHIQNYTYEMFETIRDIIMDELV
jgi:guanylate kinase